MIKRESLFSGESITQSDRCIHTPSVFAKQNLLYVQEVGRLQSLKPHRCIRENLNSYLFLVVLEGKGSLDIKGRHYEIAQGDCAFINCMEHYEHISDEQDAWKLAWVHFDGHVAKGYYELFKQYNADSNVFRTIDVQKWDYLIGTLMREVKKRDMQAELISGEILISLLNQVVQSVSAMAASDYQLEKQQVEELRVLLNEQYTEKDVLEQVKRIYGERIGELNLQFTQQFGINIEEYVRSRRFVAAKELLRFSIKPLEEVATESGIGDVSSLQQMFSENEGMTAQEYRAKWAAWIR